MRSEVPVALGSNESGAVAAGRTVEDASRGLARSHKQDHHPRQHWCPMGQLQGQLLVHQEQRHRVL